MKRQDSDTRPKEIKCVAWDLDGTLWDGILLEGDHIELKPRIREIFEILDSRGILHSIASKNDHDAAMAKLNEFGLSDYFLFPEVHWNPKSESIDRIRKNLNIGLETILFIDDQPYEREEVHQAHPEVTCLDASDYGSLLQDPRLNPEFITEDSRRRRLMYIEEIKRKTEQKKFKGPKKKYLASLNIRFSISPAVEEDLRRAAELIIRTNQLNTTGEIYGYDELRAYLNSGDYQLLVCGMEDKFGSYGKVGLALLQTHPHFWHLKLLLMSCRVVSYGVGTILLSYIMSEAKRAGKKVRADFRPTGKNKMMYVTLKFANFREIGHEPDGTLVLENDLSRVQRVPPYINVIAGEE
ncbi:MAG: HAD-IIIC family phosphatase [Acidobacteriota bacterium]